MTPTTASPNSSTARPFDTDVLILGAGPVGLTLANLLGGYGISTMLADAGDKLIDYPRGVGLDDESLRTFQTAGVVDAVLLIFFFFFFLLFFFFFLFFFFYSPYLTITFYLSTT